MIDSGFTIRDLLADEKGTLKKNVHGIKEKETSS